MFRRSYNRAILRIKATTVTPLLIRAGDTGLSPAASDLSCVRTQHGVFGRTVYIPGSSLKGVVRQAAEVSTRGRQFGTRPRVPGACDPLSKEESCWSSIRPRRQEQSSAETYAAHCLVCRTFGSLALKGRAAARDLYPWDDSSPVVLAQSAENRDKANRVEVRHCVAINRITGGAQHGALFDYEIVSPGISFWGEIALENYQMWQLGLVFRAIEELDSGFACLGSSTTRGFGQVRMFIESLIHEQLATTSSAPAGVGALVTPNERQQYALFAESPLGVVSSSEERGLARRFAIGDPESISAWRAKAVEALRALS